MLVYQLENLLTGHNWADHRYLEFLNVPSLSVGIYCLSADSTDTQQPHTEDEIYYIISGHARIRVNNEHQEVSPGTIVYVAANDPHYFYEITEDLTILVFFAPAEYSQR